MRRLARFCRDKKPARWGALSPGVRALQALVARLDTLLSIRQARCKRLTVAHSSVADSVRSVIADLDEAIAQVNAQITRTIDDDLHLMSRAGLLKSIPDLGDKTIAQRLACIGRPKRFKSVKAMIAYANPTPLIRQSGTSLNKHRATHPLGHPELKRLLYLPAMVAGRYNPLVARFWARLKAQNKPGKAIVVTCMHMLLAIAYGMLRSGKPFDVDHLKPAAA